MPCPHHDIKIVQRSNRQSAVAAAAYARLFRFFADTADDGGQGMLVHKIPVNVPQLL